MDTTSDTGPRLIVPIPLTHDALVRWAKAENERKAAERHHPKQEEEKR